jgi:transposase
MPPLVVVVKAENEYPTTYKFRSAIRLLNAKTFLPEEIHRKIAEGYGEGAVKEGTVIKWRQMFKKGRTNVHDEERSGHPSSVMNNLKGKVKVKFRKNKQFTISQLHEHFTGTCRSVVHQNVTN